MLQVKYTVEAWKSLRLDGLEKVNNNARDRAFVIHGAEYVSNSLYKTIND
jgi:hypothetical protein